MHLRLTKSRFPVVDPVSLVRDHTIKEKLVERGISVQSYNGDLLYEPWEIYCEKGKPFTSFSSYWKKCLDMSIESVMLPPPWRLMPITAGKTFKEYVKGKTFSFFFGT